MLWVTNPQHHVRLFSIACAIAAGGSGLFAQPPRLAPLKIEPDLRLEAMTLGIQQRNTVIAVAPNGDIFVAPQSADMVAFDSTGTKRALKVPMGYNRDLEIRFASRIGWLTGSRWGAATMWVADPSYRQVALLDKDGNVTKSLEHPSWVRPSWANRRQFPVFSRVDPLALYADGSWLVIPFNERSLLATPGYDKSFSYFMRIEEGGKMLRTLARVPRNENMVEIDRDRRRASLGIPLFPRTYWDARNDGSRIAIVTPNMRGRDSATFRVTTIGETGDTVFSKLYPFSPVPITAATLDSIRQHSRITNNGNNTRLPEDLAKLVADKMPAQYPPTLGVHVGRDKTVWVELRPTAPDTKLWLVLDPTGAPIGTATFPKGFQLLESDRTHAWGFERSGQIINALVRFRVR
jgi:hypothetical protein